METLDYFRLIVGLVAFTSAVGLSLTVLIQPLRDYVSWLFAAFAFSMALWGAGLLMQVVQSPNLLSTKHEVWLQASGQALCFMAFFAFVVHFIEARQPFIYGMEIVALAILPVALLLIWTDVMLEWTPPDTAELTLVGYLLLGIAAAYLVATAVIIWQTETEKSRALQLPAALLLLGFLVNFSPALARLPVDALFGTLALLSIGGQVLRFQLVAPVRAAHSTLQTTNYDLAFLNEQLAQEKAKIERLNEKLQQANNYKTEFLANISLEIRTPLNSIIGYSDLLLKQIYGELTPQQLDRMEKISRNGKTLVTLINDIVDISRIEAGRLMLALEVISPAEVAEGLQSHIATALVEKKIAYLTHIEENLCPVNIDPVRLKQVLVNLLSNAVKFTTTGHISLTIQNLPVENGASPRMPLPTAPPLRDGDWVIITVADTGVGIAPQAKEMIFEEFKQLERNSPQGGTGLGLAIAKRLIEMQNGRIWVDSIPGQGSEFHIALAAHQVKEPASA